MGVQWAYRNSTLSNGGIRKGPLSKSLNGFSTASRFSDGISRIEMPFPIAIPVSNVLK